MLERAQPTVRAAQVGCIAARALAGKTTGRVVAAFERSFYVTAGGQWICIGPVGLGAGPLNLLCGPGDALHDLMQGLVGDEPLTVSRGALVIGSRRSIAWTGAAVWHPADPRPWSPAVLQSGLAALGAALPPLPDDGLARLLIDSDAPAASAVLAAARPCAAHVAAMVRAGETAAVDTRRLVPLLGLGPGLTPAGDDFLGGAMVAMRTLGLDGLRVRLWSALAPLAATATNDVSRAHLAAAGEGIGSAALHAVLDDIAGGGTPELAGRMAAVAAIGHTSGWDALAGAVTVLRASSLTA